MKYLFEMKPLELANRYLEIFFSGKDISDLKHILAKDCKFIGSFYEFNSADAYIDSLMSDPPVNVNCKILNTFEINNSVCFIYEFSKPGIKTVMAQTFDVSQDKICSIRLIFDSASFLS